MRTLTIFKERPIITSEAQELIGFGKERRRVFEIMPERGVLAQTLKRPSMYFDEYNNSTTIPKEALLLLDEVSQFPIKQFVVGHEYPKPQPKRNLPNIPWEGIAKVVAIGMMGMVLLPLWTLVALFSTVDPCLVAVLDDGEETWICLAKWDE